MKCPLDGEAYALTFIDNELMGFQTGLVDRFTGWVSGMALVLCTLWVLFQGWMILTGRSRDSLMGLVVSSLRVVLIVTAATTLSFGSVDIYNMLSKKLPREINKVITNSSDAPEDSIDRNMALMAGMFTLVDGLNTTDDENNDSDKEKVTNLTGIGIAGPSVVGGAMLLLRRPPAFE